MIAYEEYDELEAMVDGTIDSSDFVGDILDENPNQDTTRIYIQNVNGLRWNKDGGKWPYICEVMASLQVDIACFSEINTDTNRLEVRKAMESICHRNFNKNSLVMASSSIRTTTTYKPGGTAILACNTITTRISKHTRDRLGRWTSISLQLTPTKRLRIISAYQVCQNSKPGLHTAASQQIVQRILERSDRQIQNLNPRQLFIHDLHHFIKQSQTNGELILLAGDFNDDITQHNSGMNTIASDCGLIDLFGKRLGTSSIPITYQRGSKRLDYVLLSPALYEGVQAAGYDPFGYRLPSDHRGMYIDFSTSSIFDHTIPELPAAAKREFTTSSPEAIQKYVTAKTRYLKDHRFFERLSVLVNLEEPNHDLAESLDRDFQRASFHAARKCTVKSRPPWSPQLARTWAELHYYRLLLAATKSPVNFQPAILKLRDQWPELPDHRLLCIDDLQINQRKALASLKQQRSDAQKLREAFLLRQYAQALEVDDTQKARILQRIIRAEKQHQVYSKLRYIRNSDQSETSLKTLKIPKTTTITDSEAMKQMPDDEIHWETITVPDQIERLLIQRNRHHFSQADGTPLTRPPFTAAIGYKADGYAVDMILSGEIQSTNTDDATALLLQHLQRRTVQTIDSCITYKEVLQKLKHWKESTTTSPSGLHLGHYHCSWRDPRMPPTDEHRATIIHDQKRLLQTTVTLLNYAIKFGYPFERWRKIVNVMLMKDPGNPRIHRLRVIHLYEADYNLLLAVKWRQALYHAEDSNLLNEGLYGSRPGRSAQDPALMEVLQNDIYRTSMYPGINYDLDATSCYDRILASVAVISSRRVGMSSQVTHLNALTLEQSRFHLKTKLGISQEWYKHSPDRPIHGTGQGSGNSPMIWCFVCSSLFDAFESRAHGASFVDYNNTRRIPIYMIGFVDDCTQRVNTFGQYPSTPASALLPIMETDAQLWNDLLWSSGGALEQSKCSYHLIESQWTSHGQPFLKGGLTTPVIHINHNGRRIPTRQKSNYDAHKTLGCFINPAYTRTQSWTYLSKKNESFASILESNFLSRQESWVFYTSFYLPAITYPLAVTPLTQIQCDQLDARFLRSLMPRCGYNRNMSRAIRYAPFSVGGAGYKEMYIEQGALLLQQVYKYFNSPDTVIGGILLMAASWTQAFLGTSKFFLTDPNFPIPPMGPSFLLDIRTFLRTIQGSISLDQPPVPDPLRRHDRCIMDIVLQQTRWKQHHLMQINACRRYLQAQMLSDITTMSGTRLQDHVFNGNPAPSPVTVRISMFNQARPSAKAWSTWRRFLRTITDSHGILVNSLGDWIVDVMKVRHWPQYLYSPATDTLLSHGTGSQYYVHDRLGQGRFSAQPTTTMQRGVGIPTATRLVMGRLMPVHNYSLTVQASAIPFHIGQATISNVPVWEHELLKHCRPLVSIEVLRQQIQTSEIVMCSDGSVTDKGGSFGVVISTSSGLRLMAGNGVVPGSFANSFRSEAFGVLATVRWLTLMSSFRLQSQPPLSAVHYLDNQSVIRRIEKALTMTRSSPNTKLLPDQDVIEEIKATLLQSNIRVTIEWIQGHQDATTSYDSLSLPAKLNCEADREASQTTDYEVLPTQLCLPHTPCRLIVQGHSITGHLKRRVHEARAIPRLYSYICHRFKWTEDVASTVDWSVHLRIIKKYKETWPSLIKHLYGISPTGKIAHRNNRLLPHECPTCLAPYENHHHVIQCPHPSRAQWRSDTIKKMTHYKADVVDPVLLDILQDGMLRYHRDLPLLSPTAYPEKFASLIEQQNLIGWDQLYRGRWSQEWVQLQDQHCLIQNTSSTLPGSTWTIGLGRLLIDQWYRLWTQRNQDRHQRDNYQLQEIRRDLLHRELHKLYDLQKDVCPHDRHIFHESVEQHVQRSSSLDTLEEWINVFRPAIHASVEQATKLGVRHNRSIEEYSTPNPIPLTSKRASLTADSLGG